jgi:hypothetical protein
MENIKLYIIILSNRSVNIVLLQVSEGTNKAVLKNIKLQICRNVK